VGWTSFMAIWHKSGYRERYTMMRRLLNHGKRGIPPRDDI
jgi:hypothetical protein